MSRRILTFEEAESVVPKTEHVHVYTNPRGGMLIGTDMKREEILDLIKQHGAKLGGSVSMEFKHGLVIMQEGRTLFVNTTEEIRRFENKEVAALSRRILTFEEAESVVPKTEHVHVYTNPRGGMLIGTDMKREQILDLIKQHGSELGGTECMKLKHGLVIMQEGRPLFVNTTEDISRFENKEVAA